MNLQRCHDQRGTLDAFYEKVRESDTDVDREIGAAMLGLMARLRALPNDRSVWGLTSHYRLCLLAEDTSWSPWYVIVSALDKRTYFVEYLMPERFAPWPGARVHGEARSEDEAVRMIVTAMERSEGWSKAV